MPLKKQLPIIKKHLFNRTTLNNKLKTEQPTRKFKKCRMRIRSQLEPLDDINRFDDVKNFFSYARLVPSARNSAGKNKQLLIKIKELLNDKVIKIDLYAAKSVRSKSTKNKTKTVCCQKCGKEMKLIINTNRGCRYNKPPPFNNYFSLVNNEIELATVI